MKSRISTNFLRGVIILAGVAVLSLCLFILTTLLNKAGPYAPILVGMCLAAIPFFVALYQTFKLLGYIDTNTAFSELSVKALRVIKYCAVIIGGMYLVGMPFIMMVAEADDAPGAVAIGLVIIFACAVVAVFAAVLQKVLINAIEIKRENDLTV